MAYSDDIHEMHLVDSVRKPESGANPVVMLISRPCGCGREDAAETASLQVALHGGVKWWYRVKREPVTLARNIATEMFLEGKKGEDPWTHLFFIDDDTIVMDPDALTKLLALDADIASGVVPFWNGPDRGMIVNIQCGNGWLKAWPKERILDCTHAGTACMLIRREVFEVLEYPWFVWKEARGGLILGEDIVFCQKAIAANLTIRCDSSVWCEHIKKLPLTHFAPPRPEFSDASP